MSVYPICCECGVRRDKCENLTAHKGSVRWTADVQFSRQSPRKRKTYDKKELADSQERQWYTDYERGVLNLKSAETSTIAFEQVADEWWTNVVIGRDQIKNPHQSESSRVNALKRIFGAKLLSVSIPEATADRNRYMTFEAIDQWVVARRSAGIRAGTINRDLKPLRWILQYAVERRYVAENPMTAFRPVKGERIHDRWMTQEEIDALIKAAYALHDETLVDFIAVALNTGFRLGNLERLTARDIVGGFIEARQTKSDNPYSVPISPSIESLLRRLTQQHPTGSLLHTAKIGNRFREAARIAGLYQDKEDNERVTIHTLRHTFAVLYLKRGGDIYKLSKLLGHANVAITDKVYARFCPKEKLAQAPFMSTPIEGIEQPRLKVV